jgi:AcrR family transcriptional regulator
LPSKIDRKILDAAGKVFAAHGYFGTTTKEIAVAADVTEGSIFRLFKSKENLFAEVLKKSAARQMPVEDFRALLEREGAFVEVATHAIKRWYSSADPDYLRLVNFAMLTAPELTKEIVIPRTKELVRTLAMAIDRYKGRRPTSKLALVQAQQLLYGLALFKFSAHVAKHVDVSDREIISLVVHNAACAIDQK